MLKMIAVGLTMLVASAQQAFTGFPGGILVVMALPQVIDSILQVAAINTICLSWGTTALFFKYRKSVNFRDIVFPLAGYFIFMPLFSRIALGALGASLKTLLGFVLMFLSISFFWLDARISIPSSRFSGFVSGAISGILSGLFSISSIPITLYFAKTIDDRDYFMGTSQAYFFFTCVYAIVVRVALGIVTAEVLKLCIPGLIGATLGVVLAARAAARVQGNTLKKALYVLVGCVGAWMAFASLLH